MTVPDKLYSFAIDRLVDGGYIVSTHPGGDYMRQPLFAATTIDDALQYLRTKLEPPKQE